jgi:hypothetical protein
MISAIHTYRTPHSDKPTRFESFLYGMAGMALAATLFAAAIGG